ncbi:Hypothetical protein UVM_LOCUS323 [uncultured virus]|nr:Hypothetical protein UVM_LOCUS323 [uncultured virus]
MTSFFSVPATHSAVAREPKDATPKKPKKRKRPAGEDEEEEQRPPAPPPKKKRPRAVAVPWESVWQEWPWPEPPARYDVENAVDSNAARYVQVRGTDYRMLVPGPAAAGGDRPRCAIVGVDIGTSNIALCGGLGDPLRAGEPRVGWWAEADVSGANTQAACDRLDELVHTCADFAWVREAPICRIELQMRPNTPALIVAGSLRSCLRAAALCARGDDGRRRVPDVEYVHGLHKYKTLPRLCAAGVAPRELLAVDVRELNGAANKPLRKKLGVHDAARLLALGDEREALRWFQRSKSEWGDKPDDLADAYLILRYGWWDWQRQRAPKATARKRGKDIKDIKDSKRSKKALN